MLAVGDGFMGKLLGTILGSLALFFGSWAIALVIAVRTFMQRREARRQLAMATPMRSFGTP